VNQDAIQLAVPHGWITQIDATNSSRAIEQRAVPEGMQDLVQPTRGVDRAISRLSILRSLVGVLKLLALKVLKLTCPPLPNDAS
jgi:hypothetical protein